MSGSQSEANKMTRVLLGERLKFTIRVHLPGKYEQVIEWQSPDRPVLKYFEDDRCLWLFSDGYASTPTMKWVEGSILLVEENKP